jgi:hypothetical protein
MGVEVSTFKFNQIKIRRVSARAMADKVTNQNFITATKTGFGFNTQSSGNLKDPFNWPMPKREDLMSLSSINPDKDLFRAKTA